MLLVLAYGCLEVTTVSLFSNGLCLFVVFVYGQWNSLKSSAVLIDVVLLFAGLTLLSLEPMESDAD